MTETCPAEDELLDYASHRLPQATRARLEQHIDQCEACRAAVVDLAAISVPTQTSGHEPIAIGDRIGRYIILEWLGAGGMGTVYKAFDSDLDRNIALKVLHDEAAPSSELLVREAKLAARVRSPRVVGIYDVGVAAGRVFLAMELVQGGTLADWAKDEQRPAARLAMLIEAGEGLAAAHRAGTVHGDFKPSNVLVGDGHARVTDFGLGGRSTDSSADATRTGGTPRYMSPEQAASKSPSAPGDQFSFAVTAWQVLTGSHPFFTDGETGPLVAPRPLLRDENAGQLSRRVRIALERALSFDATARFADMEALLARLRAPHRGRAVWAVLTVVVILVGVGVKTVLMTPPPCSGMDAHLRGVWDLAQKTAVRQRLLWSNLPFAEATWSAMDRGLDAYTSRWVEERTQICLATRVRKEQSEAALDAKMRCLDDDLRDVAAEISVALHAEPKHIASLVTGLSQIPRPEHCRSATVGASFNPTDDRAKAAFEATQNNLASARALRWSGRQTEAIAPARLALVTAREIGWTSGEADALAQIGSGLAFTLDPAALDTLAEALDRAELAKNDALRADVLLQTVNALVNSERIVEASLLLPVARAAVRRVGDGPDLLSRYENSVGWLEDTRGNHARAAERYRASAEILEASRSADDFWVLTTRSNVGNALFLDGRPDLAAIEYETVIDRMTKAIGSHPARARVMGNLSSAYIGLRRFSDALRESDAAAALMEAAGEKRQATIAMNLANRGQALAGLDRTAEALESLEKAKSIFARVKGPSSVRVAELLVALSKVYLQRAETAAATRAARDALEIYERSQKKDGADHAAAMLAAARTMLAANEGAHARSLAEDGVRRLRSAGQSETTIAQAEYVLLSILARTTPRDPRIHDLAQHVRDIHRARPWLDVDDDALGRWITSGAVARVAP